VTSPLSINLADYAGYDYSIWASTPAALWMVSRPQTIGIRVQISKSGTVIVDDTFGEVTLDGARLDRAEVLQRMLERTIV
jgi:hypothetical protein